MTTISIFPSRLSRYNLNHEVISKILIGIRIVIWGKLVIKREDSLIDPRFPTIFVCHTRCLLFCWSKMLTDGSVVVGWDPIEKGRSEGRPSGDIDIFPLSLAFFYSAVIKSSSSWIGSRFTSLDR
jgi:hypothetical protein